MSFIKTMSIIGLLLVSFSSLAADEKKSPWKSSAELGYVNVSGNTNTETVKAAIDVVYEANSWKHKAHADTLSSTTETTDDTVVPAVTTSERTASKWFVSGQSDYKFNDFDYFYTLLNYEKDRFSGFEYQAKLGLGYGRRVINTDNHELRLEIGPGIRYFKLEEVLPPATPVNTDTQDETLVRVNAGYAWKISGTSKFTQDLTADSGKDQDEFKSVTALVSNINSVLAMKLSYIAKRLNVVPTGNDNQDNEIAATLVYTF